LHVLEAESSSCFLLSVTAPVRIGTGFACQIRMAKYLLVTDSNQWRQYDRSSGLLRRLIGNAELTANVAFGQ
ncbi:MAG: hypothetical protein WBD93_06705, partial [Acidobacteriaceae bacterium]